jgi:hypothetical protein
MHMYILHPSLLYLLLTNEKRIILSKISVQNSEKIFIIKRTFLLTKYYVNNNAEVRYVACKFSL